MTDRLLQFSLIDSDFKLMKKRRPFSPNNLFRNYSRNLPMSSDVRMPMITFTAFANFKEKILPMPRNNKSTIPSSHTPVDFRMTQIKSHIRSFNRSNLSYMPKSSLNYSSTSHRLIHQQQHTRDLPVLNTPKPPRRIVSTRKLHSPQPPPILSQPNTPYGHFLTYLRRQALARLRRKQQEEEGNTDHIETTITLNLNKQPFQSTSYYSLASSTTETSSIPRISMNGKRTGRLSSSYRPLQHVATDYRLKSTFEQSPSFLSKTFFDDEFTTSSSVLVTPRNSVVDDPTMSPIVKPYVNDEMKNNDIKYQRQILSTAV